jgi:hypothetical protein
MVIKQWHLHLRTTVVSEPSDFAYLWLFFFFFFFLKKGVKQNSFLTHLLLRIVLMPIDQRIYELVTKHC